MNDEASAKSRVGSPDGLPILHFFIFPKMTDCEPKTSQIVFPTFILKITKSQEEEICLKFICMKQVVVAQIHLSSRDLKNLAKMLLNEM